MSLRSPAWLVGRAGVWETEGASCLNCGKFSGSPCWLNTTKVQRMADHAAAVLKRALKFLLRIWSSLQTWQWFFFSFSSGWPEAGHSHTKCMYIYLILFTETVIKSCGFGPAYIKDFFLMLLLMVSLSCGINSSVLLKRKLKLHFKLWAGSSVQRQFPFSGTAGQPAPLT